MTVPCRCRTLTSVLVTTSICSEVGVAVYRPVVTPVVVPVKVIPPGAVAVIGVLAR
ncbi:hypothetical protein [Virgisporangium aliadipatigenens]|uniref:hypothetical protein n=1 Tax=Virgisporangium aliadipatigenens TaxID=741659 RepID=UPI001943B2ED|nr:hypothetical protein [Virgisporangium aliadipatigenens]